METLDAVWDEDRGGPRTPSGQEQQEAQAIAGAGGWAPHALEGVTERYGREASTGVVGLWGRQHGLTRLVANGSVVWVSATIACGDPRLVSESECGVVVAHRE